MSELSENGLKKFIGILFFIFSIMSVFSLMFEEGTGRSYMGINTIGAWGSEQGFNIVNFVLCYILGAGLKFINLPVKYSKPKYLVFLITVTTSIIFIWSIVNQYWFTLGGMRSAWVYDNPLVIILGVLSFLLFKNIHFSSKVINSAAKCVFATFIIHNSYIIYFPIEKICQAQWYMLYISFIAFSFVSLLISWFAIKIYENLTCKIWKKLDAFTIVSLECDNSR